MGDYSILDRLLHKILLRPNFVSESCLKVDEFMSYGGRAIDSQDCANVFICGVARSGSTAMLSTLAHVRSQFSVLRYSMLPWVLTPSIGKFIGRLPGFGVDKNSTRARYHGDSGVIGLGEAEAFDEIFFRFEEKGIATYSELISRHLSFDNKRRYLSKNNQNIYRVPALLEQFPKSLCLVMVRNPLEVAFSLMKQHELFIEFGGEDKFFTEYVDLVGHSEFGPTYICRHPEGNYSEQRDINHWLEQWYLIYSKLYEIRHHSRVKFVIFDQMGTQGFSVEIANLLSLDPKEIVNEFRGPSGGRLDSGIPPSVDHQLLGVAMDLYRDLVVSGFKEQVATS